MIDKYVALKIFYIVYDAKYRRGKGPLIFLRYYYLEYFGIFWNSEYQDN